MNIKQTPNKNDPPYSQIFRKELFYASIIFIAALLFNFREVIFFKGTFVTGVINPGITNTMPYEYPYSQPNGRFTDSAALSYFNEPISYWANQVFLRGFFPFWNPNMGLGMPIFAGLQSAILDPLMALVNFLPISIWPYTMDLQLLIRYFIAGLFTYLFMRKLAVRRIGAVSAGLLFMFAPTIIVQGNIAYAHSALFFPLLMYSFQKLAKQPGWQANLWVVTSIWLVFATGFPEILPLYIGFAVVWYLIEAREFPLFFRIKQVAVIGCFSLLLSAIFLFPFGEYFMLASMREKTFSPAATFAEVVQHLSMFFVPLQSRYPPHFLYMSTLSWLMGIPALFLHKHREYAIKFIGFSALLIAIGIGIPGLNLVNNLGILSGIIIRFSPAITAFLLACAAGIGIDSWVIGKLAPKTVAITGTAIIGLILFVDLWIFQENITRVLIPYANVFVICLYIVYILVSFSRIIPIQIRTPLILVTLIFVTFWWSGYAPYPKRYDPFTKPPYIEFLEQQEKPFRVLGLDEFLYPNTASSVNLQDIRYLDALLPERFTTFAQTMLFNPRGASRFLGTEDIIYFGRGLNLSNVKYFITDRDLNSISNYSGLILDTSTETKEIYGAARKIVSPEHGLTFTGIGIVNPVDPQLSFGFGIDPQVWDCECEQVDGVTFQVQVRAIKAEINKDIWNLPPNRFNTNVNTENVVSIFEQHLRPIQNIADREWFTTQIDLSAWRGQKVEITFNLITKGIDQDMIYWGVPQLYSGSDDFPNESFPLVYQDKMVSIYSNPEALPRAYMVHHFEVIEGKDEILNRLLSTNFDPANSVILEEYPQGLEEKFPPLPQETEFETAQLIDQSANSSQFFIEAKSPGFLVVSDQYFPGWKAYIDGEPTTLYAANLTMRAVYVDTGEHLVEFVYRPVSFYIGLAFSIAGILGLILYTLYLRKRVHN